jgi:hypothetical protein
LPYVHTMDNDSMDGSSGSGTDGRSTDSYRYYKSPYKHLNLRELVPDGDKNFNTGLTDEDLVTIRIRDLNKVVKNLTKDQRKRLKLKRRTLKNRNYNAERRAKINRASEAGVNKK